MQIAVIAVGKLKESYWRDAVREYVKRLSGYARCQVIEVAEERIPDNASSLQEEQVKEREGKRILGSLRERDYVIALDRHGASYSSEEWAAWLENLSLQGFGQWVFVIGGSLGLHRDVLARADARVSFSRFTFPHSLMRVVLLEQLYRSFKIRKGEPYHK